MNEALKHTILSIAPSATLEEGGEIPSAQAEGSEMPALLHALRHLEKSPFDYLAGITCVDWKDKLVLVYHLASRISNQRLAVKAVLNDIDDPVVGSVSGLWKGAALLEDEVYDLFGVRFHDHPHLRRIFLGEDWKGYPLRKSYTDPNMIRL